MLLALAIAMLPLSAAFASAAPASAPVTVAAVQVMPDCDHHRHGALGGETQKPFDHGACIAGCALCFGFVDAAFVEFAYALPGSSAVLPVPAHIDLSSLMGSPPFRPPRA